MSNDKYNHLEVEDKIYKYLGNLLIQKIYRNVNQHSKKLVLRFDQSFLQLLQIL